MKKKSSNLLLIGLIMIGLVLRVPFTSIPPVLTNIAQGLHIPVGELGTLTTIPLLMFAICSPFASKIASRFGYAATFVGVLIVLALGSLVRIFNVPFLFIGTALIGMAIAFLNVLMPAAVMNYFPNRIGIITSIYTTVMTCATALMSALAVPITQGSSWKTLLIIITGLVLLTWGIWLVNLKGDQHISNETAEQTDAIKDSVWKNKDAWIMLLFSGLQSLLFYTGLTWLPTMASDAGLSQTAAGNLSGIYSLIGIPFAIILPAFIEKLALKSRRWVILGFDSLGIIGVAMLLHQQSSFGYWLVVTLLIGCSTGALFPYLMTSFSLKASTAQRSAELSGMSQAGGYLIAAIGPFIFGYGHTLFHSWTLVTWCLLILTVLMTIMNWLMERKEIIY